METFDPTLSAMQKLQEAENAVFEAIRLLNYYQTGNLALTAGFLQDVVRELGAGRKKEALALPIINRREAARIMGGAATTKKRSGAGAARIAQAEKRAKKTEEEKTSGKL